MGNALAQALAELGSENERAFDTRWIQLGGPPLVPEHEFDEARRWRFDRAHLAARVAIEIEGGTRKRGRHNRPEGYTDDVIKYNAAQAQDWIVFRITDIMLWGGEGLAEHLELFIATIQERIKNENRTAQ